MVPRGSMYSYTIYFGLELLFIWVTLGHTYLIEGCLDPLFV